MREENLYPDIVDWLRRRLKELISDVKYADAWDVHEKVLSDGIHTILRIIPRDVAKLVEQSLPPDFRSWTIKADIFGLALTSSGLCTAIVEVKVHDIAMDDLSQIIGYTKVVRPDISMIITTGWLSEGVYNLLVKHRRYDVLEYEDKRGAKRRIYILRWVPEKKDIDYMHGTYVGDYPSHVYC